MLATGGCTIPFPLETSTQEGSITRGEYHLEGSTTQRGVPPAGEHHPQGSTPLSARRIRRSSASSTCICFTGRVLSNTGTAGRSPGKGNLVTSTATRGTFQNLANTPVAALGARSPWARKEASFQRFHRVAQEVKDSSPLSLGRGTDASFREALKPPESPGPRPASSALVKNRRPRSVPAFPGVRTLSVYKIQPFLLSSF